MKLDNNEQMLLEEFVLLDNRNNKVKLCVTNANIYFLRKKGFIKKEYKVFKSIKVLDIKMLNERVQVKQKNKKVFIETINEEITFLCENLLKATKVCDKIITARTGNNILKRGGKRIKKITNYARDAKKIVVGTTTLIALAIHFFDKKK